MTESSSCRRAREYTITLLLLVVFSPFCTAQDEALGVPDKSSFGYAVGVTVSMKADGYLLSFLRVSDQEQAIFGFRDGLRRTPLISQGVAEQIIHAEVTTRIKMKLEMDLVNAAKGQDFLSSNSSVAGVTTTRSGLQYTVVTRGSGKRPGFGDYVKVQYVGTLVDGEVVDSTYTWREAEFEETLGSSDGLVTAAKLKAYQPQMGDPVLRVLSSQTDWWTEALQLMPVGSKFKFFVPSGLAFGENGDYAKIPPNATLFFEVTLVAIVEPGEVEGE